MRKASVISFAVLFVMAGQAVVVWGWQPSGVEIVPEYPTSCDVVVITLSGGWGNSCAPNASAISVEGNDIYFDVIWDYPPDILCADVITPWELTESVGPLSGGTYTVYARIVGYPGAPGYEPVAEFIVTATVYYVDAVDGNDLNDGLSPETAFATIQKGIDAALDGDTVIVADGIYTGNGNRDIDFLGKAITVKSENGPENCIIDCNGTYEENHRGFYFHNNEDANSTVAGFTIINGYASGNWPEDAGGAIHCFDASPVIKNCIVSGNSADSGGGIYCYYSNNATITNCVITENVATSGGGICCHVGMMGIAFNDVIITNCTFYANTATYGGAVHIGEGSNPSMANCVLWGDNAPYGPEIAMTTLDWGSALSISYSDVQGGQAAIYDIADLYWGPGNIDNDPCFYENGDYHLQSAAGRWDPNSETWITDSVTSPCIDAGNPGCPLGDEPSDSNNIRINMGAYGGTAEASKTPADWRSIADLTNNWVVDLNDLGVFVSYWLDSGQCIPSDLNRNQSVNFLDYAVFAQQWLDTLVAEAGIEYEITPCDMGSSAAGQSGETRFTVTVQGRYILFEDMMVANCCPDELELQMTVDGNLITIYEIEYLSYPCLCICDNPVTATLGPFEPGTYTLEVYQKEGYGGFIGSTTVTIE